MNHQQIRRFKACVTPIFDKEMGARLETARKKIGLSQAELAAKLGTSQQALSRLERGLAKTLENPFNVFLLEAQMGVHLSFVLLGSNDDAYNRRHIHETYWTKRLKRQPKELGPKKPRLHDPNKV